MEWVEFWPGSHGGCKYGHPHFILDVGDEWRGTSHHIRDQRLCDLMGFVPSSGRSKQVQMGRNQSAHLLEPKIVSSQFYLVFILNRFPSFVVPSLRLPLSYTCIFTSCTYHFPTPTPQPQQTIASMP